jgi:hypothetical protein
MEPNASLSAHRRRRVAPSRRNVEDAAARARRAAIQRPIAATDCVAAALPL